MEVSNAHMALEHVGKMDSALRQDWEQSGFNMTTNFSVCWYLLDANE